LQFVIGLALLLLLINVMWFTKVFLRDWRHVSGHMLHVAIMTRRFLVGQAMDILGCGQELDVSRKATMKLVKSKRLQRCRVAFMCALPLLLWSLVQELMYGKLVLLLWRKVDTAVAEDYVYDSSLLRRTIRLCIAMVFVAYPWLLTRRSIPVVYGILIFMMSRTDLWAAGTYFCTDYRTGRAVLIGVISLLYRDPLVVTTVLLANLLAYGPVYADMNLLFQELNFLFMLSVLIALVEWSHVTEVGATLAAKASRNSEVMAEKLFMSMCDATAHLDSALRIIRPSPHLAGFLLRAPSLEALRDTWFPELLHNAEEREAFNMLINRPSESFANSMHVRFRDADGTVVPAQLFHTNGLTVQDEVIHSLGIMSLAQEERPLPEMSANALTENLPTIIGRPQAISEVESSSGISGSTGSERLPLDSTSPSSMAVWVDGFSADLQILKLTYEFLQFSGPDPLRGTSFLDFVETGADTLLNSIQMFVNNVRSDPDYAHQGCKVQLKARILSSRIRCYKADVHFTMADESAAGRSNESDDAVVVLRLSHIKAHKFSVYDLPRAHRGGRTRWRRRPDVATTLISI